MYCFLLFPLTGLLNKKITPLHLLSQQDLSLDNRIKIILKNINVFLKSEKNPKFRDHE